MINNYLHEMRVLFSALAVLLLNMVGMPIVCAQGNAPTGAINGLFSVSENNQVYFSKGNLQYQASTNTWRFAENQWDFIGEDNNNVSSSYDGWIDLFAWATSGYDHATDGYQPYGVGCNAYDGEFLNLCDRTGKADWGYNAISNGGNQERQWRTCTDSEWVYLMNNRQTASGIRFVKATVNEINGIILFPDNWDATFFGLNNINEGEAAYSGNVISLETWMSVFEVNGAVFMPASGRIESWANNDFNQCGVYWYSTSHYVGYLKGRMIFGEDFMDLGAYFNGNRYSVRLVRSVEDAVYTIGTTANPSEGGTIQGAGNYDYYTSASLTAIPNDGYTFICWKEKGRVVSTDSSYEVLALFDRNLEAYFTETANAIVFADDTVKAICVEHWDTNGDGELSYAEAAAVTNLENVFAGNHEIVSFDEFQYFTGVTAINSYDFESCSLTSIVLPNTITSIGYAAFHECASLNSIIIPNSVTTIEGFAFARCSGMSQIVVDPDNPVYDSRENCNAIIETGNNSLLVGCKNTVIPITVTSIAGIAFLGSGLTSIFIPSSVTIIEGNPFSECSVLEQIVVDVENTVYDSRENCDAIIATDNNWLVSGCKNTIIPNTVTSIGDYAFEGCIGMTSITIPSSVTFIGIKAFSSCGQIEMTVLAENPPVLVDGFGYGVFIYTTISSIYVPCGSLEAYQNAEGWSEFTNFICVGQLGDEMVVNGDFEQGNVGFTSEYEYNSSTYFGFYYVGDNANMCDDKFQGFGHGGTGNFMIIDGAEEPEVIVWTEQIPVAPNTYYVVSAWVCTLYPESMALIQFSINGTQVGGVFTAPSQTNTWEQFNALWYSGDSTTATITILDQNTDWSGNDFGLDDISFRALDPVQDGIPEGAINGLFSVGEGTQVYFSQGNLQYIGSAETPYWKFADNQWDFFGTTTYQNSDSQTVDRDLFGWGTSGYNHGAVCYQPWSTSTTNNEYYAYGSNQNNLFDQTGQADWGYNAIVNGGNKENSGWRTPTNEEWLYLFNTRSTTSGIRYAKARVNNVNGMILLPDDWSTDYYTLSNTNSSNAGFTTNVISSSDWSNLEQHGAVFLPAAGLRTGTPFYYSNTDGCYWSGSYYNNDSGWSVNFRNSDFDVNYIANRFDGRTVRLVHPAEINTTYSIDAVPNPTEGGTVTGAGTYVYGQTCMLTAAANNGYTFVNWTENNEVISTDATYSFTVTGNRNLVANFIAQGEAPVGAVQGLFSVSEDQQVYFSQGNLQYQASTNTWRFAENQWDYIGTQTPDQYGQSGGTVDGSDNRNVSSSYSGWIDLFPWGTSGFNHGAVCYQPWSISQTISDYYAYGYPDNNLYDSDGTADWGFNSILNGGDQTGLWRSLTTEEMLYLFETRTTNSGQRYVKAIVNEVGGLILLPDTWETSYYSLDYNRDAFSDNVIDIEDWTVLE